MQETGDIRRVQARLLAGWRWKTLNEYGWLGLNGHRAMAFDQSLLARFAVQSADQIACNN